MRQDPKYPIGHEKTRRNALMFTFALKADDHNGAMIHGQSGDYCGFMALEQPAGNLPWTIWWIHCWLSGFFFTMFSNESNKISTSHVYNTNQFKTVHAYKALGLLQAHQHWDKGLFKMPLLLRECKKKARTVKASTTFNPIISSAMVCYRVNGGLVVEGLFHYVLMVILERFPCAK